MNNKQRPLTAEEQEEFRRLWLSGATVVEIGRRFGRARAGVWGWRKRLGLPARRKPNTGKIARFDITEEQIYAEAAKLRAKWPASRTPLQACPATRRKKRGA